MKEELEKYLEAIREDYSKWSQYGDLDETQRVVRDRMTDEFRSGIAVEEGKVYLKVITKSGSSRSVHSFIVKEDGPKFKKGDILKPAGWQGPAKNQARGNLFTGYQIRWTGPNYLR